MLELGDEFRLCQKSVIVTNASYENSIELRNNLLNLRQILCLIIGLGLLFKSIHDFECEVKM